MDDEYKMKIEIDNREPSWKRWILPIENYLLPEQCDDLIRIGRSLPPEQSQIGDAKIQSHDTKIRKSAITFIPPKPEYKFLYDRLLFDIHKINRDHFNFDNIGMVEAPQYSEYFKDGHYSWHPDSEMNGVNNAVIRKISMTLLLNDPSEYEGGDFEILEQGKKIPLKRGDAVFFASFLIHRVTPVTKGVRQSLVQWFTGTPFR